MLTVVIEAWRLGAGVGLHGLKALLLKPLDQKKNTNERGSFRRNAVPYLDREHLLPL